LKPVNEPQPVFEGIFRFSKKPTIASMASPYGVLLGLGEKNNAPSGEFIFPANPFDVPLFNGSTVHPAALSA
jgi:hypothetical protein